MENESKIAEAVLVKKFYKLLEKCVLCPHECKVNRTMGEKGFCGAGLEPIISSAMPHHGEEPPISGTMGSGTIFFSNCNMRCVYCQNFQISQEFEGHKNSIDSLAGNMFDLQASGCHNINLVSPTIWIPQIINAIYIARDKGLKIPIVFNTGGYDNPEIIKMLDGIIDIYMPDMRYSDNWMAKKYSSVKNYVENNRRSIFEMYRQVGDLLLDENGIAKKGLLVRLLVLPGNIAGSKETLSFLKEKISAEIFLSIMAQYHPEYKARNYPELSRNLTEIEYKEVTDHAARLELNNGWIQDYVSLTDEEDLFRPDFKKKNVFKYYEDR